jgi:proteasome lid subunit RPN8/RPN11
VTTTRVCLPQALADQVIAAAARAYPEECCGLIEGVHSDDAARAVAIHQTGNVSDNARREFLIDPAQQFALLRRLRGTRHDIIGCFHSHPDGAAELSTTDLAGAAEDGFVWLLAAGNPERGFALAAWRFDAAGKRFTPLAIDASG